MVVPALSALTTAAASDIYVTTREKNGK